MKPGNLIPCFLLCVALQADCQSFGDSIPVIHDRDGYLQCISGGGYNFSFYKSDLLLIATTDKELEFNVPAKTFQFNASDVRLVLMPTEVVIYYNASSYRLDSLDEPGSSGAKSITRSQVINKINFLTTFTWGMLSEIRFNLIDGKRIYVKVLQAGREKSNYNYSIISKELNSENAFSLEYSFDSNNRPSSLLLNDDPAKISIYLHASWKHKKFDLLSANRYNSNPKDVIPSYYRVEYASNGKAKKKEKPFIKRGDCEEK